MVESSHKQSKMCLEKEASILESLPPNPNIVDFKFYSEYDKYSLMGIEYAKDGTLQQLCRKYRRKGLGDEPSSRIIKSILLGLKHLHGNNYVHRDLKPSNVVISNLKDLSSLKLVDFGLAIKYQIQQGIEESCGTLVYQAPEQMDGGKMYGKPVDIWAVGFIMYECLAGKHPLWVKGDDNATYIKKAQNLAQFKYGRKFNKYS